MVPSREIIDDTAVVNDGTAAVNQRTTSYCEPVVESTVRSIRSVNTKDVSDGKATPTEDIKVTGKAGDLALGTEAGNETETNGTEASTETKLKGDSINSMTDANITSIVAPFRGDGAGFQDSSDLATKNELWHLTEEHVWPAMLAEAEKIALERPQEGVRHRHCQDPRSATSRTVCRGHATHLQGHRCGDPPAHC